MNTPPFLAWSLEYRCAIRGLEDGTDPERTERQLRAARAFSNARREGRVFGDMALDPPRGFRIAEALSIYGGQDELVAACRNCPCNALAQHGPSILAGCFGLESLEAGTSVSFAAAAEQAIGALSLGEELTSFFPATTPRWYGLWIDSPLTGERLAVIERLVAALGLADLPLACSTAQAVHAALHVRLYPRGLVENGWWMLVPHCPRCKADWKDAADRRCGACGYAGRPAADKKRRARGSRPYRLLERVLGPLQAAEVLLKYEAARARQQSPDQAQSPPLPAPPGSLPAD